MPNYEEYGESKEWLKADMVEEPMKEKIIGSFEVEDKFKPGKKRLVLETENYNIGMNVSNTKRLGEAWGWEGDDWRGNIIGIDVDTWDNKGTTSNMLVVSPLEVGEAPELEGTDEVMDQWGTGSDVPPPPTPNMDADLEAEDLEL